MIVNQSLVLGSHIIKNGKLQTDWDVVDGKGKCINYYENGNKKEEFELVNGTQNGIAISYFENGLIHTKGIV